MQAQGDICIFRRVEAGLFNGNLIKGELALALTGDIFKVNSALAEMGQGQGIHIVA